MKGLTLEGAYKGLEFYIFNPNMTKLSEPQVWNDAAAQIFFSLSVAFGGLITLSSYNGFKTNCMRLVYQHATIPYFSINIGF